MKESDLQWLMLIESFTHCINLEFSSLSNVFSHSKLSNPCPNAFSFFYYCHSGLFSKTGPKITCTRVWARVGCCDTRPGTRLGRGEVFFAILEAGTRLGTRLLSRPQNFTSTCVWGRV